MYHTDILKNLDRQVVFFVARNVRFGVGADGLPIAYLRPSSSNDRRLGNGLMRTSSPISRVFLMISKVASTALADAVLERSSRSKIERVMASFVRVVRGAFCLVSDDPTGNGTSRNMHETLGLGQPVWSINWGGRSVRKMVFALDIQEEIGRKSLNHVSRNKRGSIYTHSENRVLFRQEYSIHPIEFFPAILKTYRKMHLTRLFLTALSCSYG